MLLFNATIPSDQEAFGLAVFHLPMPPDRQFRQKHAI